VNEAGQEEEIARVCYLLVAEMDPVLKQGGLSGRHRASAQVTSPVTGWLSVSGGIRLCSFRWEVPDPRGAVVLVHGLGDHAGRYGDLVHVLGSRGYSVFAYDLRGHGRSEGRRGDVDRFDIHLEDLDRMWAGAARLLPETPLFLYGHSMGALVAIRWLQTRQVRLTGVVLSAPWLVTAIAIPLWKVFMASVLFRVAPGLAISSGPPRPEFLTRDLLREGEYRADPLVHRRISPRFHAEVLRAQAAALQRGLPQELPALVVVPGDDLLVDAEATLVWTREQASSPDVHVRVGGRHELHNDIDRAEASGAVCDWLDQHGGVEPVRAGRVSLGRT
jgi:acylglycerol lipase